MARGRRLHLPDRLPMSIAGQFGGRVGLCDIFKEVLYADTVCNSRVVSPRNGQFSHRNHGTHRRTRAWQGSRDDREYAYFGFPRSLLILVCIDQNARLLSCLKAQRRFGVNILKDTQQKISEYFAKLEQDPAEEGRLGVRFRWTPTGIPLLEDALAHLACNVVARYVRGSHDFRWGSEKHGAEKREPLLYHRGGYRSLPS